MSAEWAVALLAIVGLTVVVVVYVARPLLSRAELGEPADPRAVALLVEREGVLATLRDLDADHALGRLGTGDYTTLRAEAVARGAVILAALDRLAEESAGETARLAAGIEAEVAAVSGSAAPVRPCGHCGHACGAADRFCGACGLPLNGDGGA